MTINKKTEGKMKIILEKQGLELLSQFGFKIPRFYFISLSELANMTQKSLWEFIQRSGLSSSSVHSQKIVLKGLSEKIPHKSEVGAVLLVPLDSEKLFLSMKEMIFHLKAYPLEGILFCEYIPFEKSLGSEILFGFRRTEDFGYIVTLSSGGIYTEFLNKKIAPSGLFSEPYSEKNLLFSLDSYKRVLSFDRKYTPEIKSALKSWILTPLLLGLRQQKPLIPEDGLVDFIEKCLNLGLYLERNHYFEFEVNPFVLYEQSFIAVDSLGWMDLLEIEGGWGDSPPPTRAGAGRGSNADTGRGSNADTGRRQLNIIEKIDRMLHPQTIALAGVSEKAQNPGRMILDNIVRAGFKKENIYLIKSHIPGFICASCVDEIPAPVDLFIFALSAEKTTDLALEILKKEKADGGAIIIPGGFEETLEGKGRALQLKHAIEENRKVGRKVPVFNGGNCLGIVSQPGQINTLFIPEEKLSRWAHNGVQTSGVTASADNSVPTTAASSSAADASGFNKNSKLTNSLCILSQSGAFSLTLQEHLPFIKPKYVITFGNQIDLTLSDYLNYFAEKSEEINSQKEGQVFGVYLEGLIKGDGVPLLQALKKIRDQGNKTVIYRAGFTPQGAQASASHTASIAGDASIFNSLVEREGGVWVAKTFQEFIDALQICTLLGDLPIRSFETDGEGEEKRTQGRSSYPIGVISNAGYECVAAGDHLLPPFTLEQLSEITQNKVDSLFKEYQLSNIVDIHNPLDLTPMARDEVYQKVFQFFLEDPLWKALVLGCVPLTPALNTEPQAEWIQKLVQMRRNYKTPWVFSMDSGAHYDSVKSYLQMHRIPVFEHMDQAINAICKFVLIHHRKEGL